MISGMIIFLSLISMIVFHELGHFIVARCFNVAITRFSIGFGRPWYQWKSKKHLTKFSLCPILLGGYVQFSEHAFSNDVLFANLKRWKKILILLAGPLANFVLAFLLLTVVFKMDIYEPKAYIGKISEQSLFASRGISPLAKIIRCNEKPVETWSETLANLRENQKNVLRLELNAHDMQTTIELPAFKNKEDFFKIAGIEPYIHELPAMIGGFTRQSIAKEQGLKIGDKIIRIQGHKVNVMDDIAKIVQKFPHQWIEMDILRNQELRHLKIQLGAQRLNHQMVGFLGITSKPLADFPQWFEKVHYSWLEAVHKSLQMVVKLLQFQWRTWMNSGENIGQLSGLFGMVKSAQDAWGVSSKAYLLFLVWLNLGIGILNLLPIPILDGGQCLILIMGKWIPAIENESNKKHFLLVSMFFILLMFLLGTFNDWTNFSK